MTTILVVEDEPAIAESLRFALRREGYAVMLAGSLAEAEPLLAEAELLILDLMLPDGSGFELLLGLRRRERAPAVIILSSRDAEADRVAGLETGADDYVTKPFSPREIVARVRAVLRRAGSVERRERQELPMSVARHELQELPMSVEPTTRRASVHGGQLELTRVEFDLLACMLESPGRVFTRAQLIERLWGDGFAITDRTVDSHVKALRRKVSDAGGAPTLIETVRGVGYRVSDAPATETEAAQDAETETATDAATATMPAEAAAIPPSRSTATAAMPADAAAIHPPTATAPEAVRDEKDPCFS
ncbi:MAG: response regulator transcription factor [Myxococcales bacterium]|nr:response regulator transcription factor [Myxococcales bacterium]